jgi:hypothetical protein
MGEATMYVREGAREHETGREVEARPASALAPAVEPAATPWWLRTRKTLEAHPLATLAGLGVALLLAAVMQGGMSERLHTTWRLTNTLDRAVSATMPLAGIFRVAVAWVPRRLPGVGGPNSAFVMAMLGYALTLGVLFAIYTIAAGWVARHADAHGGHSRVLAVVVGVAAVTGLLLLFTPAAPSHDPFAYATSGRLMLTYNANPFFTIPGGYPSDPVLNANEWPISITAYGPLWSVLSLALAPIVGADPLRANMVYRVVALAAELGTLALLAAILRRLPARYASWRTQGLLLYAWNPLVLIEVAAGHNDVLMLALLLLGLWLLLDARRTLAALALGAAILIKASALPLVGLMLVALLLRANPGLRLPSGAEVRRLWSFGGRLLERAKGITVASVHRAGARPRVTREWLAFAGVLVAALLAGYLPFYWGHTFIEINAANQLQPSAQALDRSVTSSFGSLGKWIADLLFLPKRADAGLEQAAMLLAVPSFWLEVLGLGLLVLTLCLLPDLRRPLRLPVALAAVYAAWMLFFCFFHLLRTWYLIPLVGLVCLTPLGRPMRRFALALTASTQLEIFFLSQAPPFWGWQPWTALLVAGIPLAVLLWELRRAPAPSPLPEAERQAEV